MTRREAVMATTVALAAVVGCAVGREPSRAVLSAVPGAARIESAVAPVGSAVAKGAEAPAARAAGPTREWSLETAPSAVVSAIRGESGATSRDNDVTALDATPVDLDDDGAPEWLVSVETEFPAMVNRPLFAFAERSDVWSTLGFLGAGYEVMPSGEPRDGYAPLCVFERDGPDPFATEFAWRGARYEPGARYQLRSSGQRLCEQKGIFIP